MEPLRDNRLSSGQAMVEFTIALFAIVLIIAGICDFIAIASRHSEIFATLRGKAGAAAIDASANDAGTIIPEGATPAPVLTESRLASSLLGEESKEEVPLSDTLRKWLYQDRIDSITVHDEVWLPPLEVRSGE